MSQTSSSQSHMHTSSEALKSMATRWLEWQCKMISEVKFGAVFLENEIHDNTLEMLAVWSEDTLSDMGSKLYGFAEDVVSGKQAVMSKVTCVLDDTETVCDSVSLPLHRNDKIVGAVIFLQPVRSEDEKNAILQLFQWGTTWLEASLDHASENISDINAFTYNVIKASLLDEPIALTGYKICNIYAEYFQCTRAALGKVNGLNIEIVGLSNQFRFDERAVQLRDIELAMEESSDQKKSIVYPKFNEIVSLVTQKHHLLSTLNNDASLLTIPLLEEGTVKGIILLIRPKNNPFKMNECKVIESASDLLSASLAFKFKEKSTLSKKIFYGIKEKLQKVFGKGNFKLKMILGALILLFSGLFFLRTTYFIYAKSSLEGAIEQIIVAPYDGFIKDASVRAGETVHKGDILVRLDDNNLKLEYRKFLSEREKTKKEYREALALRERSKINILTAQISQVDAQLDLIEEKRHRSTLKAPFSGIVVSGDLSQSLGAPVEKGKALFKLSPLGDYRVILNVDDEDISKLHIGDKGSLRLVGLPYDALPIAISRIIPISSVSNGGNYFHVEARLPDMNESRLKPGMQGIAKVEVGEDRILWVMFHTVVDRIRLWLWSLGL